MSHVYNKKPCSLRKSFTRSGLSSSVDDHTLYGSGHIEDDWEFIEFLDKELSGGDSDAESEIWYLPSDVSGESLAASMPFTSNHKIKYKILSKDDVRGRLESKVDIICSVLALSKNEAVILLLHYKWDVSTAQEKWLSFEDEVRKVVGLLKRTVSEGPDPMEGTCCLCYGENLGNDKILSVSCGHGICADCWADHIGEAIKKGPECVNLHCPGFFCDCNAAVGRDIIDLVCSEEEKKKYDEYLIKSWVTLSKKGKWCPAPGCDHCVYRSPPSGIGNNDVTCQCFYSFCWNCMDEAHGPIDCVTAGEWKSEICKQSGNWLLANAKPCRNCEGLYEDNSCQMYSTCPRCDHKIWGSELEPDPSTPYRSSELNDYNNENLRELARQSLKRFHRHYEGWSNCESARKNAITNLKLLRDIRLGILCDIWDWSKDDLEFLTESQLQVVECWRILEWTYVYSYYLIEEPKQHFFKFLQDQATNLLRMLENHVDNLQDVLMGDVSRKQYISFRTRLIQLTRVTRNYFDKIVDALNSGLSEVQPVHIPSQVLRHVSSQGNYSSPGPSQCQSSKVLNDEDTDWHIFSQGSCTTPTQSWRPTPEVLKDEADDKTNYDVTRELGDLRQHKRASPALADERDPEGLQYW